MSSGTITLNLATSVDGYVATEDGGVAWLEAYDDTGDDHGAMASLGAFLEDVDCLVMGSRTYEGILGVDEWPYGERPTYVATGRELPLATDSVEAFDGDVGTLAADLKRRYREIWLVGGAALARTFLRRDLLDELWLTVVPTLLGSGIALFGDDAGAHDLELIESREYATGVVDLRYRVVGA